MVVLPDLVIQPGGWAEFDVAVTRGDANASRLIRAKVSELGGGFRLLVGHDVQDRRAFRAVMLRSIAWPEVWRQRVMEFEGENLQMGQR